MDKTELPGASPVQRMVRPRAWAHSYSEGGSLFYPRLSAQDAADDAEMIGGTVRVVALYDQAAIDTVVMAERKRCAQWLRDNYQDHPSISSLCDALIASSA